MGAEDDAAIQEGFGMQSLLKIQKFTVALVSAKTGYGFDKIVRRMEKLKKVYVTDRIHKMKPKVFILGCTNAGKSSFLNKLISHTTKNKDKRQKGIDGKVLYDRESDNNDHGMMKGNKLLQDLLTVSPIPGTTMDFIEVQDLKFGLKVYDTPGVPNSAQVVSHIKDYQDAIQTFNNQKIISISYNIKSGYTMWLGALARLDFLNGERTNMTFCMSPHVTFHRTPLEKGQKIYDDHAGNLLRPTYTSKPEETEFETHEISLKMDDWYKGNYDLAISGLGWISFTGQGVIQLLLHIPKGIKYSIREPLMPFEVEEKGLDRYTGKTVNLNSKKNVDGRERFQIRQSLRENNTQKK